LDLGQFKNPKDMLKSYKEIQAAFTKTTQENKQLKQAAEQAAEQAAAAQQERELMQNVQQQPAPTVQSQDFETAWMEDPQKAIDARVVEQVNMARINDVVEEEKMKDPAAFIERDAYARSLAQNPQYAHLGNSPAGVRQLFKLADNLRVETLKSAGRKSLEYLLGEPVTDEHIDKLKQTVGTPKTQNNDNSNAYMPDADTSTRTAADQNQGPDYDQKAREAAQAGDVDGVLDSVFKPILDTE
jgi:hypothetical protein